MNWAQKKRLEWIDNRINPFNRRDIMNAFNISVAQASIDIKRYIDLNPNTLIYDTMGKEYKNIKNQYFYDLKIPQEFQKVWTALSLFNSMIYSGEYHTETSIKAFEDAKEQLNKLIRAKNNK